VRSKRIHDNQVPQKDQLCYVHVVTLKADDKNIHTLLMKSADGWGAGSRAVSLESFS